MFGSIGPIAPGTLGEYIAVTLMMLVGSMVWAWVIGSLCGILATLNPHVTRFRNQMDELNHFLTMANMPKEMRTRLRDFFLMNRDYDRQHAHDGLLHKMSVQLRGDTALRIGVRQLAAVPYFKVDPDKPDEGVEKEFLSVVALNLSIAVYEMKEIVPTYDLTIIDRGVATLRLAMLTKGMAFGQDCLVPGRFQHWRPNKAAFSLTFLQTSSISRTALFTMGVHFPQAEKVLRRASARYTLSSAFRLAFNGWRSRKQADRGLTYTTGHAALKQFGGSFYTRDSQAGCQPSQSFSGSSFSSELKSSSFRKFTRQASRNSNAPHDSSSSFHEGRRGLRKQNTVSSLVKHGAASIQRPLNNRWLKMWGAVQNILGEEEETSKTSLPASSWSIVPPPPEALAVAERAPQSFIPKRAPENGPAAATCAASAPGNASSADTTVYSMDFTAMGSALRQQDVSAAPRIREIGFWSIISLPPSPSCAHQPWLRLTCELELKTAASPKQVLLRLSLDRTRTLT